ncbi:MAG: Holliday junction resolvase RuvX [Clostridiales bacterium]|nr:Holliday junction resolvase RuvX [Clostridiales bacterium]
MESIEEIKKTTGRIMAVDFGDTRTGIAVSDPGRLLASGVGCISPGGIEKTADAIAAEAMSRGVSAVVVGLPKNMNGSEGPRAMRCRELAALLRERLDIPVVLVDERLTTLGASRYLDETDTRGKKRKRVIDSLSAEIILQKVLDRLKNN